MSSTTCPKCQGPRDAKSLYCPFCGVVFARYTANPGTATPTPPPAPPIFRDPPPQDSLVQRPVLAQTAETMWEEGQVLQFNTTAATDATRLKTSRANAWDSSAPRWKRLAAQLLNVGGGLGLTLIFLTIGYYLELLLLGLDVIQVKDHTIPKLAAVAGLLQWLKMNLVLLASTGQSYGKMWLGIRIVRTNGEQPTLAHLLFMRWLPIQLISLVPVVGQIVSIVDVLAIFSQERRCLHDRFADTKVIPL